MRLLIQECLLDKWKNKQKMGEMQAEKGMCGLMHECMEERKSRTQAFSGSVQNEDSG